ncbi:DUF2759 family protein [Paraliobacillus salinarum]|uniref:DUF2759 family protein n=1 Tax=Paraliobacillus salinarum TaxID=1158996 RepID=UPI0015F41ED3
MALAVILILITCLSSATFCKEIKSKNLSTLFITGSSTIIFGFFSISKIIQSFF